jgi:uncharacterized protein DUF6602
MSSDGVFDELMDHAEEELWLSFKRAKAKKHNLSRGESREEGIALFLQSRLPSRFRVTSGEAVDAGGRRTGQLDIVIYDCNRTVPLLTEKSGDVLPAESLLAVVEVKSTLTQNELDKCAKAARAITQLRPGGEKFSAPRQRGRDASDGKLRCQYSVIAYNSDLASDEWCEREWKRLRKATKSAGISRRNIDRVIVFNRGMLVPPSKTGRASNDEKGMLRHWFLHLTNFVIREADRRGGFDFQDYGRRKREPDWKRLD